MNKWTGKIQDHRNQEISKTVLKSTDENKEIEHKRVNKIKIINRS